MIESCEYKKKYHDKFFLKVTIDIVTHKNMLFFKYILNSGILLFFILMSKHILKGRNLSK